MSERTDHFGIDEPALEKALQGYFAVEPAADFLPALEQRLLAAQAATGRAAGSREAGSRKAAPGPTYWQRLFGQRGLRPLAVAAILLLLLLIPLLLIGPQRAWAGLQAWLGYVPGVGFVDLENTRVLLAPAAQARDGVTLRVSELIAGPENTTVVVASSGLPSEEALWGREGAQVDDAFAPVLRLPDGATLPAQTFTLRFGGGTIGFPPLPPDVYQVTLELPLLPLVPPGAAPEAWSLPLLLQPATGELVGAMYPQPYSPQGASATHHGVTLSVLQVAHTPERTAFVVQAQWQDESWAHVYPDPAYYSFYDDVGHIYSSYVQPASGSVVTTARLVQEQQAPAPQTAQRTFDFGPLSLAAGRLSFEVPEVSAMVPAAAAFSVDLGARPQVGDSWDLDIEIDVAGFPVRISRAWLATEQVGGPLFAEQRTNLYFYIQPVAPQGPRRLSAFGLSTAHPAFQGSGGSGLQVRHLTLAEGAQIPSGELAVQVMGANVALAGPWLLAWDVPDSPALRPTALNLQQEATAGGLNLRLNRAVLTDRVTALELALVDAPEGLALQEALSVAPGERQRTLTLEDDRLHDYWFEGGSRVWWQPQGPAALAAPPGLAKWLYFPPLRPLARSMTLQIPALLLARADDAAFGFTLAEAQARAFDPDAQGDGRQRSESWPIDARFTIAGYDIHLTEATLLESAPASASIGLSGVVRARDGQPPLLHALRLATVVAPDGTVLHGEGPDSLPYGSHSLARCDGRREACDVSLIFPLSDRDTGLVQAGRYQVTLHGVSELRQGPWLFNWALDGASGAESGAEEGRASGLMQPYAPAGAQDSAGGVTLQALAVAHSEGETAVYAQARWPDGFWQWDGFEGAGVQGAPLLRDEAGQVYEPISAANRPLHVIPEVIERSCLTGSSSRQKLALARLARWKP